MQWLQVARKAGDHSVEVPEPDKGVRGSLELRAQRRVARQVNVECGRSTCRERIRRPRTPCTGGHPRPLPFTVEHPGKRFLQRSQFSAAQFGDVGIQCRARLFAATAGILDRFPDLQGLHQERRRKRPGRELPRAEELKELLGAGSVM